MIVRKLRQGAWMILFFLLAVSVYLQLNNLSATARLRISNAIGPEEMDMNRQVDSCIRVCGGHPCGKSGFMCGGDVLRFEPGDIYFKCECK